MSVKCYISVDLLIFSCPSTCFSASFGISHIRLSLAAPDMRFSSHNFCTCRSEIPPLFRRFWSRDIFEHYSFLQQINLAFIIYGQLNDYKKENANYLS